MQQIGFDGEGKSWILPVIQKHFITCVPFLIQLAFLIIILADGLADMKLISYVTI
jgi:hypothetical protein